MYVIFFQENCEKVLHFSVFIGMLHNFIFLYDCTFIWFTAGSISYQPSASYGSKTSLLLNKDQFVLVILQQCCSPHPCTWAVLVATRGFGTPNLVSSPLANLASAEHLAIQHVPRYNLGDLSSMVPCRHFLAHMQVLDVTPVSIVLTFWSLSLMPPHAFSSADLSITFLQHCW